MPVQKEATINLPLSALRWLYSDKRTGTVVCEMPMTSLKRVNINKTKNLEEIIAEAEVDYTTGNYKSFKSPRALMSYLNS